MKEITALGEISNDGNFAIGQGVPYIIDVSVEGTAPFLFHRWSVDGIEAKSKAAKGSKAKKEDDLESYVYRDEKGHLSIPTEYFRMSIINAAKYKQDPTLASQVGNGPVQGRDCLPERTVFSWRERLGLP